MKKFNIKAQFIASLMIAGITSSSISGAHTVLAMETVAATRIESGVISDNDTKQKSKLSTLVEKGVISEQQKIIVESAIQNTSSNNKDIEKAIKNITSSGILSNDQKTAIEEIYLNPNTT